MTQAGVAVTVVVVVAILGPAALAILFSMFARLAGWATLAKRYPGRARPAKVSCRFGCATFRGWITPLWAARRLSRGFVSPTISYAPTRRRLRARRSRSSPPPGGCGSSRYRPTAKRMRYLVKFTTLESTTALAAVAATPNEPEPRLNPFGKATVVLTPAPISAATALFGSRGTL